MIDGVNGQLYRPGASDDLAHYLRTLLADADLRREMGSAGVKRAVAEFDQQRVIERTLAVYRRLLPAHVHPVRPDATSDRYADSIDLVASAASKRLEDAAAPLAS